MEHTCTYSLTVHRQYDPTHTTVLRNQFARAMTSRFRKLTQVIREAIVDQDCFGLQEPTFYAEMVPPGRQAFAFPRSSDKIRAFMDWLTAQVELGVLETRDIQQLGQAIEVAWTDIYIQDSYKRGVIRARYEMQKAGFEVPSLETTGGIEVSMSTPFHLDRVGVLFTRAFNELKGITAAMDQQISRVLAQGIADGDNPVLLARKLVSVINGTGADKLGIRDSLGRWIPARRRAQIMARTEIIRAHHQATIQEYRNWAVEGVTVQAEWMTAGDDRVCSVCAGMQGDIYTLDVIQNMIPVHPQCRCVALPFRGRR